MILSHLKERMLLPISDQHQPRPYLSPFPRYGHL